MLLFVILVSVAVASATSPVSPPCDRPPPPGCSFPTGPYVPPECPPNEYFEVCSYKCPSESCYPDEPCDPGDGCCSNACRCNKGYCRNREGLCVSSCANDNQPDVISASSSSSSSTSSSISSASASASTSTSMCGTGPDCPKKCRPTCKVPNPNYCIPNPKCTYCGDDKLYDEDKGACVAIKDCPFCQSCNGDINARIREYPPPCPSTCAEPEEQPCKRQTDRVGCVCNPDYILSDVGGWWKCIKADNCPGGNPCGVNGTFSYCKVDCPSDYCPVDDRRVQVICDPARPCRSGCVCNHMYQRKSTEDNTCILAQECPKIPCTSRPNEEWNSCPGPCFSDSCDTYKQPPVICETFAIPECYPQCVCKKGYARDKNGICIKGEKCPGYCESKNATYSTCLSACPRTCELPNGPQACIAVCRGEGCACKKGYVLYKGNCIKVEDCPPPKCGPNSTYKSCPSACPKTCELPNGPKVCPAICLANGCECNKGYVLNNGKCIKVEDCPRKPCLPKCRPTCAVPNPPHCPNNPYNSSDPGACKKGFILSKVGGKCIRVEDCPPNLGCNGDINAIVKECPLACPSTCSRPNAVHCKKMCVPLGCECKEGYILSDSGKCIPVNKCPGGNPCGKNEIFVRCKVPCDKNYCPVKDKIKDDECETPKNCLSGCVCKHNYRRKSKKDPTCIPAENCPPIPCTRVNEEWKACRPFCPRINCEQANLPCSEPFVRTCDPRCNCCDGYCRNKAGKCVPTNDCHKS